MEKFKLGKSFSIIFITLLIIIFILYGFLGYFDKNGLENAITLIFFSLILSLIINFLRQVVIKLTKSKFKIENDTKKDYSKYGILLIIIGIIISLSISWFGSIISLIGIISIIKSQSIKK